MAIELVRWQGTLLRVRSDELDRYPGAERVSSAPEPDAGEPDDDGDSKQREARDKRRRGIADKGGGGEP